MENNGIYIDGMAQVRGILGDLSKEERIKIISKIKCKNNELADNLSKVNYNNKKKVPSTTKNNTKEQKLKKIFSSVKAEVLGLVLRGMSEDKQKKILSLTDREYAKKAFKAMTMPIINEKKYIEKAKKKFIEVTENFL